MHPKTLFYEPFAPGFKIIYVVLLHSAVFPLSFKKFWLLLGIHCTDYGEKITLIILFTLKLCLLNPVSQCPRIPLAIRSILLTITLLS